MFVSFGPAAPHPTQPASLRCTELYMPPSCSEDPSCKLRGSPCWPTFSSGQLPRRPYPFTRVFDFCRFLFFIPPPSGGRSSYLSTTSLISSRVAGNAALVLARPSRENFHQQSLCRHLSQSWVAKQNRVGGLKAGGLFQSVPDRGYIRHHPPPPPP